MAIKIGTRMSTALVPALGGVFDRVPTLVSVPKREAGARIRKKGRKASMIWLKIINPCSSAFIRVLLKSGVMNKTHK